MDGVAGWFERRGEIPLVPPLGLREYGPVSDDPDHPDESFVEESVRGAAFALEYCDTHGWASTRTVRCLAADTRGPGFLKAFCNVRRTNWTFRIDRIISILDLRSGRVLSADEHLALLALHLPSDQADASVLALRQVENVARDGVFALLQLAMPEGRLPAKARDIVIDYVRAEAGAAGCDLPSARTVSLWIDNLAPPLDAVVASVTKLLDEKDKFVRLLPWLLKVVRSQDSFAVQEESVRDLIAEIRQHFRRRLTEWPAHRRATS